jgi:hypothetical protein
VLLAALAAPLSRAEAAGPAGPFDKLDAIGIAVEVGGPLDLEGGTAPQLFTGEVGRFSRFRTTLSRSVGRKLESCGILWDEGARADVVSIFVFGRLERPPQGPPLYVYMVKGEVLNSKLGTDRSELEPFPLRPVLGFASDDGLEAAIIDAAVAIVSDELGSCES